MKKYVKYGVMALVAFVFIGTFVFLYQKSLPKVTEMLVTSFGAATVMVMVAVKPDSLVAVTTTLPEPLHLKDLLPSSMSVEATSSPSSPAKAMTEVSATSSLKACAVAPFGPKEAEMYPESPILREDLEQDKLMLVASMYLAKVSFWE